MLVLSRKPGEMILVPGCGVAVKVVSVRGKTIRLGISAPADVRVLRSELGGAAGDPTHSILAGPDVPRSARAQPSIVSHADSPTRSDSSHARRRAS